MWFFLKALQVHRFPPVPLPFFSSTSTCSSLGLRPRSHLLIQWSVARKRCVRFFTFIVLFTASSSIHVALKWGFQIESEMIRWCNKWNFGLTFHSRTWSSRACTANFRYVLTNKVPTTCTCSFSSGCKNIPLDIQQPISELAAHTAVFTSSGIGRLAKPSPWCWSR